jgi:hypothetical protein
MTDHNTRNGNLLSSDQADEVFGTHTDLLRVTVVTPPEKFPGTVRNGVTSTEYGRYQYAWKLSAV